MMIMNIRINRDKDILQLTIFMIIEDFAEQVRSIVVYFACIVVSLVVGLDFPVQIVSFFVVTASATLVDFAFIVPAADSMHFLFLNFVSAIAFAVQLPLFVLLT